MYWQQIIYIYLFKFFFSTHIILPSIKEKAVLNTNEVGVFSGFT